MLNKVILLGRLTKDVDVVVSKTANGEKEIQKFSLAVNTGRDTEGNPVASFFDCVAFDNNAVPYLNKGDRTVVTGRLNQRKYENKEGKTISVIEILVDSVELLEAKREDVEFGEEEEPAPAPKAPAPKAPAKKPAYRK